MKKSIYRKIFGLFFTCLCFISLIFPVNAKNIKIDYEAPIYMNKSIEDNKTLILQGDIFTVNYIFQPQPISIDDIPFIEKKDKEIVLIMDTSGSMRWDVNGNSIKKNSKKPSRISLAKSSAIKFLEKLKDKDNIKVALVSYSDDTIIHKYNESNIKFFNKDKFNNLESKINYLYANGGTNIGKGMYEGYKLLDNDDSEKYLIFLTDGVPTYYSFYDEDNDGEIDENSEDYYTYEKKDTSPTLGGTGSSDPNNYCLNYAVEVGNLIAKTDIESYFVAFADNDAGNMLEIISNASNGHYKKALTGDALKNIYEELGEQISSDISIKNIYFEETFPDSIEIVEYSNNLTVDGNTVKGEIGSINYNLNDEGTFYIAEPIKFSITLKANEIGKYILGENDSSFIRYKDINETLKVRPFIPLEINVYEDLPPNIQASLFNSYEETDKYTLNINIDEVSKLEIYNIFDELIAAKEEGVIGDNNFELTIDQLKGNYLKIKAIDQFENSVVETVPIIKLNSFAYDNKYNLNNKIDAKIELKTESNSIIDELIVNDRLIDKEILISDEGIYTKNIEVKNGINKFKLVATNLYGNNSTWHFNKNIMMDNIPPEIKHNLTKNIFYVKDESDKITVYVESDGTGSKILETHYKKLEDGKTTADISDFSDVIGKDEALMMAMTVSEIKESIFAENIDNEQCKHEKFYVDESGYYAIYAKDEASNESVIVIEINYIDYVPDLL